MDYMKSEMERTLAAFAARQRRDPEIDTIISEAVADGSLYDGPQTDADEREALVDVIDRALPRNNDRWDARRVADALLAAGWPRGTEVEWLRGAAWMRERAAAHVSQDSLRWRFSTPWAGKDFAEEIRALPLTRRQKAWNEDKDNE